MEASAAAEVVVPSAPPAEPTASVPSPAETLVVPAPPTPVVAKERSFADLPAEIHVDIWSSLPPLQLVHVVPFVCRLWKTTANQQELWQFLCQKNGWDGSDRGEAVADWKRYYWLRVAPVCDTCTHFIPPEDKPLVDKKLPISLTSFYYQFLPDERREEEWNEFHRELGYTGPPNISKWMTSPEGCCNYRILHFTVHLTNPLGPKCTRVDQTQRMRFVKKGHMMFSTSSVSLDVPYSDAFTTESLWHVTTESPSSIRLVIAGFSHFKRSVFLRAAIARGAQGAIDTYFPAWAEQAAKKVERIQAAKRRLEAERRRVNQITSSKLVDDLRVVSDVNDSMMRSRIAHDEGEELQDMPKEEEKVEGDKEEAKTSSEDTLDGIGVHRFSVSTSPRPAESSDKTRESDWISTILVWIMDLYAGKNRKQFFIGLLLLLLLLSPSIFTLYRISSLRSNLYLSTQRTDQAESILASLYYVVGQMNFNITGVGNGTFPNLPEQWDYWQNTGQLDELFQEGLDQVNAVKQLLERAIVEAQILTEFLYGLPSLPSDMKEQLQYLYNRPFITSCEEEGHR